MRYLPFVFLFTILYTLGCNTVRNVKLCTIEGAVGHCAEGKKKYDVKFPGDMVNFSCWDYHAQYLLGEKLQECEQNGRLPKDDNTIYEMKICQIYDDNFVKIPCRTELLAASVCTDEVGMQKITDKIVWCSRR